MGCEGRLDEAKDTADKREERESERERYNSVEREKYETVERDGEGK